jgi:hypothetical protein
LSVAIGLSWLFFRYSVSTTAAIVAASFGCVLTVIARLGADGLSDSTHLALLTIALWAIASALSGNVLSGNVLSGNAQARPAFWPAGLRLVAAGVALACAQLTRVEAAVVAPTFILALAIEAFIAKRVAPAKAALAAASLVVGMAIVFGPYLIASRPGTAADAVSRLWGRRGPSERTPLNARPGNATAPAVSIKPDWRLADGQPMAFGRKDTASSMRFHGLAAAIRELGRELAQSLNYVLGLLALAGLWFSRSRIRRPVDLFLALLVTFYVGCVLAVAGTQGYLAGRHVLLVVWLTLPWAGAGVCSLGERLAAWMATRQHAPRRAQLNIAARLALSIGVGGACLATTLVPLHSSHGGHERAIEWLATEADDGAVLDSAGYTALYSGRKTYRYAAAADAFRDPDLAYLVIQQGELTAPTARGATMRELLGHYAEPAAIFAPPEGRSAARTVMLFRWRPWEFAHYLRGNNAR